MGHAGPCGHRAICYRPDCRDRFGDYPTVEILRTEIIHYCHRSIVPIDDVALRMLGLAA
jgi:hypothetical protein